MFPFILSHFPFWYCTVWVTPMLQIYSTWREPFHMPYSGSCCLKPDTFFFSRAWADIVLKSIAAHCCAWGCPCPNGKGTIVFLNQNHKRSILQSVEIQYWISVVVTHHSGVFYHENKSASLWSMHHMYCTYPYQFCFFPFWSVIMNRIMLFS